MIVSFTPEYIISERPKTWTEALKECLKETSHLVTIDNEAENSRIKALIKAKGKASKYWISLREFDNNKTFLLNSTVSESYYRKWATGEPKGNCAHLSTEGYWYGSPCNDKEGYICEKGK